MGIRFSSSFVFIFYILFLFSFCLLQMFVIHRNYLIEKKNTTVYSKCDQTFDLWQQLDLACELESDL